jgi:prepilin-type N-terminal cleavage/methylation domain-containing protein
MDSVYNRISRRRRRGQGGFTLIELLVVIAVLAVLSGIVIFNVAGVANKGNTAAACTDVKSVQTAVDAAINDGVPFAAGAITGPSTTPGTEWASLVPAYIHTQPPAKYGSLAAAWNLTSSGANGGFTVDNGVPCP